jgi:ATP-dependent DNA ligase
LTYFAFDLRHLDGVDVATMALVERKERLATLLKDAPLGIAYSEHEGGDGQTFGCAACRHGLEGIVSKRTDRRYLPGDRRAWVKSKCLNRGEFVIIGWSEPEGSRHAIGALPLSCRQVGRNRKLCTLASKSSRISPRRDGRFVTAA